MRSDAGRWAALAAALALGGCSYEWDALRPGADSGRATDAGRADTGAVDAGAADTGAVDDVGEDVPAAVDVGQGSDVVDVPVATDDGLLDAGTADTGPRDGGTIDAGTPDVGSPDTGPRDTGPVDVGTPDTGPRDTGPVDVGTPDAGSACTGPLCPCGPATPAGWCAVGATCTSGACVTGAVTGSLVITEIMNDPDVVGDQMGEWFEVYNVAETPVDLRGLRVRGSGTETFTVTGSGPLLVAGRGYAVLGKSADALVNGGVTVIFAYGSAMDLSNSTATTDVVTLLSVDGATTIDAVTFANTVSSGWPVIAGRSKSLRPAFLDDTANNTAANWCPGGPAFGRGDFGTPGASNVCQ